MQQFISGSAPIAPVSSSALQTSARTLSLTTIFRWIEVMNLGLEYKLTKIVAAAKRSLKKSLRKVGLSVRQSPRDESRYLSASYDDQTPCPADAWQTLRLDNPQLQALRSDYRALDLPACRHTVWDEKVLKNELTLPWFRGDNAYVWQLRQTGSEFRLKEYLKLKCIEAEDNLNLLSKLTEDGAFGCWTYNYGQRRGPISRDLLESINEINFLERHLRISQIADLQVLDVGAGYGRLAHRMCTALPNVSRYDCVDAVPESTFLCDYYLRFRDVDNRARAVPLTQLDSLAEPGAYFIALNIHSFSECPLEAVRWWLAEIARLKVPWLLIVPNHPDELLTSEADGGKQDFAPAILEAGYELICKQPVFNDDEIRELIGLDDPFFLFKRL
jgi:hypothetical protein